jgi:hypothetical protein
MTAVIDAAAGFMPKNFPARERILMITLPLSVLSLLLLLLLLLLPQHHHGYFVQIL